MSEKNFDLIVIGAGPGGYVAAIRAAQLGFTVAVVEKRQRLGGVCLNEGCIPSKALLDSSELFAQARDKFKSHGIKIDEPQIDVAQMLKRKEGIVKKLTGGIASLFKKNKIERLQGAARLGDRSGDSWQVKVEGDEGEQTLSAARVLLATGSAAAEIPSLPFDDELVVDARGALEFPEVPEHLLVVGGGYIGLELGSVWARLGAKVTVVEMLPQILPNTDGEVAEQLLRSLKKQGFEFLLEAKATELEKNEDGASVTVETKDGEKQLQCDRILVAAGRKPLSDDLGLEDAGVDLDDDGRVPVDKDYATSAEGVFAIGDLVAGPMLAHKAMEEGVVFAERLKDKVASVDYPFIPGIIYTHPEAASVGKTEEQLKEEETDYRVGKFPFVASGRAKCMEERDGFVKILATPDSGRVLGIHILGPQASELIAEAVTVMSYGGSVHDIAITFHAHPTLSEAVKEAALATLGEAIHA
ncbi:MAG: dihydrolipoyl dehydrogenase [Desulfuromonadales bacterium]|nr:dihydrolipoyl dehydrogenase [Desulfuromonadales bacterium]NIS40856.1 dihydrolipoyl dehydrogenase [Desulfuromonadales bacterium]